MRRAFSVAVFARHAGRVLLVHHRRLGTWLPVGGEVEAGETPLEAAERELREETGLTGRFSPLGGVDGTPPGLLGYEEHPAGSKGLHLNFCFVADVDTDAIVPCDEFGDHGWYAGAEDLDCPANVRQLVRMALSGGTAGEAVARRWLETFNARDLDGLLALYADDAVHVSPKLRARRPETKGEITGKDALRAWWQDSFDRLPGLRYDPVAITASGDRVFLEYLRVLPGDETMAIAEVYVLGGDGRIVRSHVYHG